jgi:hypothetical protein
LEFTPSWFGEAGERLAGIGTLIAAPTDNVAARLQAGRRK